MADGGGGVSKPAVAPPSIGHELGIMFAFVGPSPLCVSSTIISAYLKVVLMILSMALYFVIWQLGEKRSAKKERERRDALSARGLHGNGEKEKQKGVDRGFTVHVEERKG